MADRLAAALADAVGAVVEPRERVVDLRERVLRALLEPGAELALERERGGVGADAARDARPRRPSSAGRPRAGRRARRRSARVRRSSSVAELGRLGWRSRRRSRRPPSRRRSSSAGAIPASATTLSRAVRPETIATSRRASPASRRAARRPRRSPGRLRRGRHPDLPAGAVASRDGQAAPRRARREARAGSRHVHAPQSTLPLFAPVEVARLPPGDPLQHRRSRAVVGRLACRRCRRDLRGGGWQLRLRRRRAASAIGSNSRVSSRQASGAIASGAAAPGARAAAPAGPPVSDVRSARSAWGRGAALATAGLLAGRGAPCPRRSRRAPRGAAPRSAATRRGAAPARTWAVRPIARASLCASEMIVSASRRARSRTSARGLLGGDSVWVSSSSRRRCSSSCFSSASTWSASSPRSRQVASKLWATSSISCSTVARL